MKKILLITGPIASFLAFKCPVCVIALLGLGAGIGSLGSSIHTAYWVVIIGLGVIFTGFLYQSWRTRTVPGWVLGLGAMGLVTLILEAFYPGVGLNLISTVAFLAAAGTVLFSKRQTKAACGACNPVNQNRALNNKGENIMATRKVEVFTSGCPVCEPVVELVKKTACPSCEVIIYDLNKGCDTDECRDKAKQYGINRVPAVVVDGKLLDCCQTGAVSEEALRAAGVDAA